MILFTTLDLCSVLFNSLYLVPIVLVSGRSLTDRLALCICQILFQAILIKLTLSMMVTHAYSKLAVASHLLRFLVIVTMVCQVVFWRPDVPQDILLSFLNVLFPAVVAVELLYQFFAVWVCMSVIYWTKLMVTKRRIRIVLNNLVYSNRQVRFVVKSKF